MEGNSAMPLIPQSDPSVDPSYYDFAALDTKPVLSEVEGTTYFQLFDAAEEGQMAHWVGRWVNTRGNQGPWSDTVSATVAG